MTTWLEHVARWRDCTRCPLSQQRSNIVLARGQVPCDVLFVGEAPGASEDALAQPFVGPAGQLLDQIVERALPKQGHDVHTEGGAEEDGGYPELVTQQCHRCGKDGVDLIEKPCLPLVTYAMTNLVCCFPREAKDLGYNEPEPEEIKACRPRLVEFIGIARPKLIVCVGTLAGDWIGHDAYGRVMGAKVVQIVHPAHILARLPLAQKQMAVQKCIVIIRSVVEDMLQSKIGEQ